MTSMNKIIRKEQLAKNIKLYEIKNVEIASKAAAGQFVIVRLA